MENKKKKLSGIIVFGIIIIISFSYMVNPPSVVTGDPSGNIFPFRDIGSYSYQQVLFSSYSDFTSYLKNNSYGGHYYSLGYGYWDGTIAPDAMMVRDNKIVIAAEKGDDNSVDYSETNIQVEGVDEPDVVKTDGKYLYVVSGNTVYIIFAYPVEDAEVVSKITFNHSVSNIFINDDRLVIFGDEYNYEYPLYEKDMESDSPVRCPWFQSSNTIIKIYDVSDRSSPELKKEIVVAGGFYNARMIGDHVYLITNQYTYNIWRYYDENEPIIPMISIDGVNKEIPLTDIYCVDIPSNSEQFTHVVSINIKDDDAEVVDKIFTLGSSQTMYVSKNNIYISYQISYNDYNIMQQIIDELVFPLLPDDIKEDIESARSFKIPDYQKQTVVNYILQSFYQTLDEQTSTDLQVEIQKRMHRTIIHKIGVNDGKIEYLCNGSVPGRVLNQFSLDEHNGYLRVATQTNAVWQYDIPQCSNVYVLDKNLKLAGAVTNIAPSENMHSARFMGDRAYLVTFKKTDPFFVIDLSDPENPEILGELKIPGYSDYLHPYDQNHIIGIGKDTVEPQEEYRWTRDFAWYQGIKIALFDVSDPENPKEVAKIVIGDRGTSTPVLYEHKAFLFDREKELLVLPVSLHEISDEIKAKNEDGYTGNTYGQFKLQGAFVYKLNAEDGFELQGIITHGSQTENNDEYYYTRSSEQITRSLYIEDVLYTISNNMIKLTNLDDLSEITSLNLN